LSSENAVVHFIFLDITLIGIIVIRRFLVLSLEDSIIDLAIGVVENIKNRGLWSIMKLRLIGLRKTRLLSSYRGKFLESSSCESIISGGLPGCFSPLGSNVAFETDFV
jgi:hypothetical protein